ncbi:MAG: peptidoglycan editing factor PgeF [Bacteroides sp.]
MIALTKDNRMLGYQLLSRYSNISHFVTTREGGCSGGNYASFSCSPFSGDEQANVARNQEILCSLLPQKPEFLLIPFQTHGTKIAVINTDYIYSSTEQQKNMLNGVDALITNEQGCCLCISTADCIPVLLYDPCRKVVAAVHAGWRGTVAGIVSKTLELMRERFQIETSDVIACIGPGISAASFEVGEEVYETFKKEGFAMEQISFLHPQTNKWHIDLWEANRLQLIQSGVQANHIEQSGICTYVNYEQFFSARRLGIRSGRILSGIMLNR